MKIGSWGWGGRLASLSLGLGVGLGGLGACGRTVTASDPKAEVRVQPVVIEGGFTCPMGLQPAFRFEDIGMCTDGTVDLEDIPPETCAEAGLPSCGVLEPVGPELDEPEPTPEPMPGSSGGLSTADCSAFDLAQLTAAATDQDCDVKTPETCPEGTHIDWVEGSPCASCVADSPENRSCAWATACFEPFIESIAHGSGAKSCTIDSDCSVMRVAAGCGPNLSLALSAMINEEIPIIAELYAQQNCSQCADSLGFSYDLEDTPARCVDGVCR